DMPAPMLGDERHRHLAGTEAGQAHAALTILEPAFDPLLERLGRNYDPEFALEPLSNRFCNLHRSSICRGFEILDLPIGRGTNGAGGGTRTPTTFVTRT